MSEMSVQSVSVERRREKRVQVRLPVEIRGTDRSGRPFDERTTSENLCRGGVAFTSSHELDLGSVLDISIPVPRVGQQDETDFATRGEVRHVYVVGSGRIFGVAFTGPRFHRMFSSETAADA